MTAYLLDVNVLVALAWPEHTQHGQARAWFVGNSAKGWATCPLVEAGFVRIVSNPVFSPKSVSVKEAVEALRTSLTDKHHQFWADSICFPEAADRLPVSMTGHQQVTDAYLIGLAIHHQGKLATLDRGVAQLGPAGVVEVIG